MFKQGVNTRKVVWKTRFGAFRRPFANPPHRSLNFACKINQANLESDNQKYFRGKKTTLHFAAIANILNFECNMSSNSVIPTQAGIHRKTWETLIWRTVSEFQKWIPACAGMTADDYDRRRIKTNTSDRHSCPTCICQSNAKNTKGRLKNRIRVFRRPFSIQPSRSLNFACKISQANLESDNQVF